MRGVADRAGWLDELLVDLNLIQRCWVYLEPIFGGGPLPQEQGRFKHIKKELRWPAVAAHTAHSNASCSTDLTCMCTCCTCTYCEIGTGIDAVFSFHCGDNAVHYC